MSNQSPISTTNLFARIETMKKWQMEHQQRLLEHQTQQTNFLTNEQRRMQEAFDDKQVDNNNFILELDNTSEEDISKITDEEKELRTFDIDELPIKSPSKDFNMLLEEKLNGLSSPVIQQDVRPKRPFLKKGTGLSRFRMSLKDVNKSSQSTISRKDVSKNSEANLTRKEKLSATKSMQNKNQNTQKIQRKSTLKQTKNPESSRSKEKYVEPIVTWKSAEQQHSNYNSLLTELCNARQQDPQLFESPVINKSSEVNQKLFERDLLDELKLFEALEQKVSNSSFCSNSSLVTRLMEHPTILTPQKKYNFSSLVSKYQSDEESIPSPKRNVYFSESVRTPIEEETTDQSDDETESSSDTNSSVNSDDISDSHNPIEAKHRQQIIYKDVATNTEFEHVSTELLKTRLEDLENEIETFRSENVQINKLKTQFEIDLRNLEKEKSQLRKEIDEEKQEIKQQLNDEKNKLMKDKQVYDKYIRESREVRTLRQKDRDELTYLRNQCSSLQEEIKLKESKWGATHARLRNQVRHLEKENTTLKIENTELRSKNGKLEATNKQLLSRRPSDTKVLHQINKNLSKLTQENKPNKITKSKSETTIKKTDTVNRSLRSNTGLSKTTVESHDENNQNSLNTSSNSSKCSTAQSFESIEREYEKLFGSERSVIPAPETSCSDTSSRREETLEDGSLQISYPNGNIRTISANGKNVVMKYHNGDVKEICKESGTTQYLYSNSQTVHTTYPDGLEILEFANGQIEKRFGDGSTEILFPNGCRRCTSVNGSEEVDFPDGTILLTKPETGEKVLTFPNGQKEIHTADHKRREYPDGTVKLLYPDGIQETRYANGRIRLKDKDGNLIMDSATV